jgi:hypothetical protein
MRCTFDSRSCRNRVSAEPDFVRERVEHDLRHKESAMDTERSTTDETDLDIHDVLNGTATWDQYYGSRKVDDGEQ